MFRVYNLDKFEKDIHYLKNIIDDFDRSEIQQKVNLCEKINPILEIHSHCKSEDKEEEFSTEGECKAKNIENIPDFNVYRCNREGCKLVKKDMKLTTYLKLISQELSHEQRRYLQSIR